MLETGSESVGRVTGFEPATSRITISRLFLFINPILNFWSDFNQRETAALRALVAKNMASI